MALPILAANVEIPFKGVRGEAGASMGPQSNEILKPNAKNNLCMSPMSSISTAPPSPSVASMVPDSPCSSTLSPNLSSRFARLTSFELDSLLDFPIAEDEESESEEKCKHAVEKDGVTWTVTRGAPPSIEQLEGSLSDVKALYKAKFGQDVDDEEQVEKDGVTWTVTRGAPPSIEQLEGSISDVKALYKAKFGQDVDDEEQVEKDGVTWTVTRGAAPSIEQLEGGLSEVKALFKAKFGQDVDDDDSDSEEQCEHEVKKDGVTWIVTRGAPPSIKRLEDGLSEVKALYKSKFGQDFDDDDSDTEEGCEHQVEKDGVMWTVTRGAAPSITQLESSLSDVKALYKAKFGQDVDDEDSDTEEVEKDGVRWTVTRGAPPSIKQLEDGLSEVKALYEAKFGCSDVDDEDSESEEQCLKHEVEKDGVTWTVTRGAPPSIEQLEASLSEVKALFKAKFGQDVDSENSESEEQCEHEVEKDGIKWTVTRGAPPSIEQLEDGLSDVKALYKAKFGQDVDAESDSGDGEGVLSGLAKSVCCTM